MLDTMPELSPSPFLAGTAIQLVWDSTSLDWLKTCPRKYKYSMIDGWRAKAESPNLTFGILYHSSLEHYDRYRAEGQDHESALRGAVLWALIESKDWKSDDTAKNRENLVRSVVWYLEEFKDNGVETVILANGKPAVELTFKMELDYGPRTEYSDGAWSEHRGNYILSGHLDRIVKFAGDMYVSDRKTTKSTLGSSYFRQYEPHNQMSPYTVASQVVFGTPVKGIIIDAAQIAVGFTRFARGITLRTKSQLEEWLKDTEHWLRQAEGYAVAGYWPQNDSACMKYGGCPFMGICSRDPSVREKFLESDFEKKHWNPAENR